MAGEDYISQLGAASSADQIEENPYYKKLKKEIGQKRTEKQKKEAKKPKIDIQDKVEVSKQFKWYQDRKGEYHLKDDPRKSAQKDVKYSAGKILQLDNFRYLRGYGWQKFAKTQSWRQDKGHAASVKSFLTAIRDGRRVPIPFEDLIEVSRETIEVGEAARGRGLC